MLQKRAFRFVRTRVLTILSLIAFVIVSFASGAWLATVLSTMPAIPIPPVPGKTASPSQINDYNTQADRAMLRRGERNMAIATAVASPLAIMIVLATVVLAHRTTTETQAD
jgi:hypothetical protein